MSGQKKQYKDTLKASLKTFFAPTNGWQNSAVNRETWRTTINKGPIIFERDRLQSLDEKRMTKKNSHQSKDIAYLGYMIDAHGISTVSDKVEGVKDALFLLLMPATWYSCSDSTLL